MTGRVRGPYPDGMQTIGIWGLAFIVVAGILFFVPKRLPEIGRGLGRGMREFKDAVTGKDKRARLAPPGDSTKR